MKAQNTNIQVIVSNCFNLLNLCAIGNTIIENNHPIVDIENNIINIINPIGIINITLSFNLLILNKKSMLIAYIL